MRSFRNLSGGNEWMVRRSECSPCQLWEVSWHNGFPTRFRSSLKENSVEDIDKKLLGERKIVILQKKTLMIFVSRGCTTFDLPFQRLNTYIFGKNNAVSYHFTVKIKTEHNYIIVSSNKHQEILLGWMISTIQLHCIRTCIHLNSFILL